MSKAFTKDDDGPPPPPPTPLGALPAGTPNLLTADGFARLGDKVQALRAAGELVAAGALAARLERAQVVGSEAELRTDVTAGSRDVIRFGDQVEVSLTRGDDGAQARRVRIVGVDEVDLRAPQDAGAADYEPLSWLAPLAQGLLGAEVGDVFTTRIGRDEVEVEIIARG